MKEPMCNYVFKVPGSSNYQFRRKIPQDLIPHYNKKEVKQSLRTADRREATKLSRIEAARLDAEWDAIRCKRLVNVETSGGVHQSGNSITPLHYRDATYMRMLDQAVMEARANLPEPNAHNVPSFAQWHLAALRAERRLAVRLGYYEQFLDHTRSVLDEQVTRLSKGLTEMYGGDFQFFHVTEAIRNAHIAFLNGDNPTAWFNPVQLQSDSLQTLPSLKAKSKGTSISMFALVEKWAAEGQRNQKTIDMYNRTATRFRSLVGPLFVQEIKRIDVVRFKDELLKIGQSPQNTNKQLIVVNTLLNYAKANAIIDDSPASGVSVKVERKEKPRVSFDAPALNAIFSSPIYTHGQRPKGGGGEAAYWIPLLALFTGARLEELGQLHPSDITEESYLDVNGNAATAWVIRIKNSREVGQSVKNFGSNRRIPIHDELIRLGFLSYAAEAKQEGRYRIFDQLVADKYGTETAQFSKWFNRYLRKKCGVTNDRMTFHSFRHTFKDFCRTVGIDAEIGDRLTGHASGGVGSSYGADQFPLLPLVNAMKRYRTPGFSLLELKEAA
jgi:integrase